MLFQQSNNTACHDLTNHTNNDIIYEYSFRYHEYVSFYWEKVEVILWLLHFWEKHSFHFLIHEGVFLSILAHLAHLAHLSRWLEKSRSHSLTIWHIREKHGFHFLIHEGIFLSILAHLAHLAHFFQILNALN